MKIKKILVPVDFSEASRPACAAAFELAEQLGASVTMLHVVDYPPPYSQVDALTMVLPAEGNVTFDRFLKERAQEEMKTFISPYAKNKFRTEFRGGTAADGIVEAAKEGTYDLIVMGTHGRTGLRRLMIGSVAERTIRTSPCPVLTIPTHQ